MDDIDEFEDYLDDKYRDGDPPIPTFRRYWGIEDTPKGQKGLFRALKRHVEGRTERTEQEEVETNEDANAEQKEEEEEDDSYVRVAFE